MALVQHDDQAQAAEHTVVDGLDLVPHGRGLYSSGCRIINLETLNLWVCAVLAGVVL